METQSPLPEFIKYKPDELDEYLRALQRDLTVRNEINKSLEKEVRTCEANSMAINNFIERYDTTVKDQLSALIALNSDFKKQVNLHKELKDKTMEYKNLLNSERCTDMRNKLNQIKEIKQELQLFLDERGIPAPKI